MAHIANRSRFRVTVKNKSGATRYFSFNKPAEVEAYMKELRAQHLSPKAAQLDESWLIRVRDQGHLAPQPHQRCRLTRDGCRWSEVTGPVIAPGLPGESPSLRRQLT